MSPRPALRPLDDAVAAIAGGVTAPPPVRPASLAGRAALLLADGPLAAQRLMPAVCGTGPMPAATAERLADALLKRHHAFRRRDDGRWELTVAAARVDSGDAGPDGVTATEGTDGAGLAAAPDGAAAPAPHDDPPLAALEFAVVDVETTGSRAGVDRVTEIAVVRVGGGTVRDRWRSLVNPGRRIPPAITALTGITDAMVREAPPFAAVADELSALLDGAVFVAHNAAFDWRFVNGELAAAGHAPRPGAPLCTVRLARRLLPTLPRRSLDHVTAHLGIAIADRHRALGDADATAAVLVELLARADAQGWGTWRRLQALLAPASRRARAGARAGHR